MNLKAIKSKRKEVLYCLLIGFALLFILEGFLRIINFNYHPSSYVWKVLAHPETYNYVFFKEVEIDKKLLWKLKADVKGANSLGFRGPELTKDKEKDVVRVFCLGDSCTYLGEPPYPQVLENMLNDGLSKKKYSVINAGVPGYTSFQGLRLLEEPGSILKYRPDLLIIRFGVNDHWLAWGEEDKNRTIENIDLAKKMYKLKQDVLDLEVKYFSKIRIYQLTRKLTSLITLISKYIISSEEQVKKTHHRVLIPDYQNNLTKIITIARDNNIKLLFLTSPHGWQQGKIPEYLLEKNYFDHPDKLIKVHENYNNILREICRSNNVPFVDLALTMNGKENLFLSDGIHETKKGISIVANAVYNGLKSEKLIPVIQNKKQTQSVNPQP